jgi:hypothetical protein
LVLLEPPKVVAFVSKPKEHTADTTRMLADLEKTATLLEGHLCGSLGLKLLDKNAVYQFFSYLFNLEEWASRDELSTDDGMDRQIVKSPVAWHSDHLTIGRRYVQMFSLKTTPEASRPCLFSNLTTLDCDSILCTAWWPKSTAAARSEIDAQEKFISFFKVGVLTGCNSRGHWRWQTDSNGTGRRRGAGAVLRRDGPDRAVEEVVWVDRTVLSQAGERSAADRDRADAAHLFFAAVVQLVGPGSGRRARRFAGDAAVRGH